MNMRTAIKLANHVNGALSTALHCYASAEQVARSRG